MACPHEYIVMPNHVHAIIELVENDWADVVIVTGTEDFQPLQRVWQLNFYEPIIRNYQSYKTISDYIINNPAKWNIDKFFMK